MLFDCSFMLSHQGIVPRVSDWVTMDDLLPPHKTFALSLGSNARDEIWESRQISRFETIVAII